MGLPLLLYVKITIILLLILLIKDFHIFFANMQVGEKKSLSFIFVLYEYYCSSKALFFQEAMICDIIAHKCSMLVNKEFT